MPAPLEGIRVIDFGTAIQGPLAATFLADMGAEVIKIESPTGDGIRWNLGPFDFPEEASGSPMFLSANRGKRYMNLDAHTEESRQVIHKLIESADVFVTNYREAALQRLGFDYDSLAKINPRLIYGAVSGFGHRGPVSANPMYDLCAQARSGIPNVTGQPHDAPNLPGAMLADQGGATMLALGIMTALVARERHGVGQKVDTSAYGTLTWLQSWEITHTGLTGQLRDRAGSYHPLIAGSYGVYRTRDGKAIAYMDMLSNAGFEKFCAFGGIPELAKDERFDSMRGRVGLGGAEAALIASEQRPFLERAFASHTLAEWKAFLDELGSEEAVYQEVFDYQDILDDPQALACEYIVERDVPGVGKKKLTGNPITLSKTPSRVGDPGGEIGQNNEEILLELGYDWDFISKLREQTQAAIDAAFQEHED
jgi:crotonobetainyl-CoA:carnitine CoA-transferase CaiB-like acyl-CoA transferase